MFLLMSKRPSPCNRSNSLKMSPSHLLSPKSNLSNFIRFPNGGMMPFKRFPLKFRKVRLVRLPICGGMFPSIMLFANDK